MLLLFSYRREGCQVKFRERGRVRPRSRICGASVGSWLEPGAASRGGGPSPFV